MKNVRLPLKGEGKVPGTEWRHYKHAIHQNTPSLKYIIPLVVQNKSKRPKIIFWVKIENSMIFDVSLNVSQNIQIESKIREKYENVFSKSPT